MIFKKIEMAGFKSFADRIEIPFSDGVTAIVGPNGCGKSNVADSIRWVLGEQSSKLLRGKSMQDVIFKGTQKRKSLSYCEVTLLFDNTTKVFNIGYDEVAFTRKLYRDGQSEYCINKNPVRLKDIIDLLHDSGIGKEGYSIIGQGRVEQIISSKPEERRGIFEEAAGIAKYKDKKKEYEKKLEKVRENLTRINDLMSEVQRRIGPLQKQSETAKKYLELKHNLEHHEINTYIYQYESTNDIKEKISNVINGLQEELNLRNDELNKLNIEYVKNMNKFQSLDGEMKALNDQVLKLSLNLQKIESDNTLFNERIGFIKDQIFKSEQIVKDNNAEIVENEGKVAINNVKVDNLKKDLDKLDKELREITNKYLAVIDELSLNEDENEQAKQQVIDALEKLSEIKANLSALQTEKEGLIKQLEFNKTKLESIDSKIKENQEKIDEINAQNSGVDVRKHNLEKQIVDLRQFTADADFKMKLLERNLNESISERKVKMDRKNLISSMQADFEGYAGAVKKLLKDSTQNVALSNNIMGIIGKVIKVPEKLEIAIEMALGNAIHNVVTKNEEDAQSLIAYLKENKYGRATFLPLTSIKPRNVSSDILPYLKEDGVLGVASDLITFDSKYSKAILSLLGATVIANDLQSAVKLSKKINYALKVVTLEGDIINPAGSVTGGSAKSTISNLLSRDREIEELSKEITALNSNISKMENDLNKLSVEYDSSKQKLDSFTAELNKINVDFAGVFEKRARFEEFNERLLEEKTELQNSNKTGKERIEYITTQIASIDELENTVNKNKIVAGETNKARSKAFEDMNAKKEEYFASSNDVKIKIASCEQEMSALTNENDRLNELNEQLRQKSNIEQMLADKNKKTISEILKSLNKEIDISQVEIQEKKLADLREKLSEQESSKKILQERVMEIDANKNELNEKIGAVEKKKVAQEMQLQKVDIDLQNMQDRIYEEYSLTYDTCLQFKVNDYDYKQGHTIINDLKKQISALGPINTNAVEEYKAECERFEYFTEQTNDANKAEAELMQIIEELSSEMLSIFNDKFSKIQANFSQVYSELFGGGHGELLLVEGEDPLSAGVEILAQPPGKKLQELSLFSGGEKALTAIAILFAILKLRPMPFVLLDEIEAALDDANVERFAKYLKRFKQETQFIVITHRKPTMELADNLFGVSMEEPGISKVLSVRLSDAVKNAK